MSGFLFFIFSILVTTVVVLLFRLARLAQDAQVKKTQYDKQMWELRTALDAALAERSTHAHAAQRI